MSAVCFQASATVVGGSNPGAARNDPSVVDCSTDRRHLGPRRRGRIRGSTVAADPAGDREPERRLEPVLGLFRVAAQPNPNQSARAHAGQKTSPPRRCPLPSKRASFFSFRRPRHLTTSNINKIRAGEQSAGGGRKVKDSRGALQLLRATFFFSFPPRLLRLLPPLALPSSLICARHRRL